MVLNTVISASAGGIVGGIVTYITVKKTFDKRTLEAVEDVKKRYALLRKEPAAVAEVLGQTIEEASAQVDIHITEDGTQIITEEELHAGGLADVPKHDPEGHLQYHKAAATVDEDEPQKIDGMPIGNLWEQGFSTPAYLEEKADMFEYEREPGKPYLISREEHEEGPESPKHHEVATLVYYEGDNTLASYPSNSIIVDIDRVIGARHLAMFGVKSGDPQTVYIRNDDLSMDYEVVHEAESFNSKVLNLDAEFTGDAEPKRRPGRMRNDD